MIVPNQKLAKPYRNPERSNNLHYGTETDIHKIWIRPSYWETDIQILYVIQV